LNGVGMGWGERIKGKGSDKRGGENKCSGGGKEEREEIGDEAD